MSVTLPKKQRSKRNPADQLPTRQNMHKLFTWLASWEIYPILFVASFLRLYQLSASEFDGDQAAIFGLAREAVHFGLWPIVSNRASIGIENPPAVIYLLMLPAALSADPLWAVIMVALLNTLAVLLTYFFTRRYYGRLAGIIAALLYAAATKPLNYSRFIWQQNMLAPLIVLFIFALFWGTVERRKGWFIPAVLLLGVMYQLHETSTLLAIPLLIAVVLAPGTLRWRDLAFALVSVLVIFSPYIFYEFSTHFADVHIILQVAKLRAHIDTDVITLYKIFLSPYGYTSYYQLPGSPTSLLRSFGPMLFWLRYMLLLLLVGGLATTGITVFSVPLRGVKRWWTDFRVSPYRCGLTLLLVWQVLPVVILLRHSVTLYPYYLLILMPGPFIFMSLFIVQISRWTRHHKHALYWHGLRYGIYAIIALTILAQVLAAAATLSDAVSGNYGHGKTYNDLGSLQRALNAADQLAQQHHLNRVYITTDPNSQTAMSYLAAQMHTPTTLFDDSHCLVLPNASEGPAVLLASPYAQLTFALLTQFATATLMGQSSRLGAPPFQLYIVTPRPNTGHISTPATFVNDLQLVDLQNTSIHLDNHFWLVSRWNLLRSAQPNPRTIYTYAMAARINTPNGYPRRSLCSFTTIRPTDQLYLAFALPNASPQPKEVSIEGQTFTTLPYNPAYGSLHVETDQTQNSPARPLQTTEGKNSITVSLV